LQAGSIDKNFDRCMLLVSAELRHCTELCGSGLDAECCDNGCVIVSDHSMLPWFELTMSQSMCCPTPVCAMEPRSRPACSTLHRSRLDHQERRDSEADQKWSYISETGSGVASSLLFGRPAYMCRCRKFFTFNLFLKLIHYLSSPPI